MSPEILEKADEKATNSLLYSLMMGNYTFGSQVSPIDNLPINDKVFLAQSQVIREAAEKGPCVIVGRCADYVLRENKNCLHVYVYANHFTRMDRIIKQYGVDPAKAADTLVKQDKQRANYYNFYSNQKWGNPENYDLLVDSSAFGIENSIDLICQAGRNEGKTFIIFFFNTCAIHFEPFGSAVDRHLRKGFSMPNL